MRTKSAPLRRANLKSKSFVIAIPSDHCLDKFFFRRWRGLHTFDDSLLADHQLVKLIDIDFCLVAVGHNSAVAHHINAVRNVEDLVHPVRDEDHGLAMLVPADLSEQGLNLGRVHHGSRLVKQDNQMAMHQLL